jgi:D-amino-acid oxidase
VAGIHIDTYIADDYSPTGMRYVLPRLNDIVLGDTQDFNVEDATVDLDVGLSIIERCARLVPALSEATVLEHMAGVRPYRSSIRCEVERDDGQFTIHNYGHGGSGVSLSWGCAHEVVSLVAGLAGL